MKKKIITVLISIVLVLSLTRLVFATDGIANENCKAYDLSLARINSAYDYLNEVYLTTNLGTYVEYSTKQDIDTLTRLANDITVGCITDEEKCIAIWHWMDDNVKIAYGSYAPIDVFRTMSGVCSGHAQLMSALMKLSGIQSAILRGYLLDTNKTYMQEIYSGISEGHQWVMAYYNNDWHLFDDLWGECGNNDREDIASKYYTVNVDGISAYTEEIDITKDEFRNTQTIYKDGEFIGLTRGTLTNISGANLQLGGCIRYSRVYYTPTFNAYYASLDNAINTTYGYAIAGGYYTFLGKNIHYIKENGISLNSTVVEYNNQLIFMNGGSGIIIDEDIDNNGFTDGRLNMYEGETLDFSHLYGDDAIFVTLKKNVVSINGKTITAIGTGVEDITVRQGNSIGNLQIYVYGDARTSKDVFKSYCTHENNHTGTDSCVYCDYCGVEIEQVLVEDTTTVPVENLITDTDITSETNIEDCSYATNTEVELVSASHTNVILITPTDVEVEELLTTPTEISGEIIPTEISGETTPTDFIEMPLVQTEPQPLLMDPTPFIEDVDAEITTEVNNEVAQYEEVYIEPTSEVVNIYSVPSQQQSPKEVEVSEATTTETITNKTLDTSTVDIPQQTNTFDKNNQVNTDANQVNEEDVGILTTLKNILHNLLKMLINIFYSDSTIY